MADSPFCLNCLANGRLANTYKVNRQPLFKCGSCKRYSEPAAYEQIDYEWRTKYAEWSAKVNKQMEAKKLKPSQEFKGELDRVKQVGKK